MKKLLLIPILFICTTLYANPAINDFQKSTFDSQVSEILGVNFGNHNLDIEWLGGQDGLVESSNVGSSFLPRNSWSKLNGFFDFFYAQDDSHSYNKSLKANIIEFQGTGLFYDMGTNLSSIYVTWWVKMTKHLEEEGQWKMFRVKSNYSISDGQPEICLFNWFKNNSTDKGLFNRPYSNTWDSGWTQDGSFSSWRGELDFPRENEWVRMEFFIKPSAQGVWDGKFVYRIHRPNVGLRTVANLNNVMNYGPDVTDRYRYLSFQNYQGNGLSAITVWYDDMYIQKNTQARIELGDQSTWGSCTFTEIQYPLSWENSKITFNLNQGSFQNGDQAYLFVIDSNGVASPGYPITVGGATNVINRPNYKSGENLSVGRNAAVGDNVTWTGN